MQTSIQDSTYMYLTQPRSEKEHKDDEPGMEGEGDEGVLSRFREGWDGWDLMGRRGRSGLIWQGDVTGYLLCSYKLKLKLSLAYFF